MKKALILILLLASTVSGSTFLGTREDYYAQVRLKLGLTVAASGLLTDTAASAFLSEAIVQIVPGDGYIKKVTTISTLRGVIGYAFDTTLVSVQNVWWHKSDTVKYLIHVSGEFTEAQSHKSTIGTRDPLLRRPSYYQYTDDSLYLYPAPSLTADNIYILGYHRIGDVTSTDTLTAIPEQYRTPILNYMVWAVSQSRGLPEANSYFQVLQWSLAKIGMKVAEGGAVETTANK